MAEDPLSDRYQMLEELGSTYFLRIQERVADTLRYRL
jgi:hypothetical protein